MCYYRFIFTSESKNDFFCITDRCFLRILHVQDHDVVVDPEVAKFLLRKNIELINAKTAKEKQQQN